MTNQSSEELKHSVAFRVTEREWRKLKVEAERTGTTVPQLAKHVLFKQLGVEHELKLKSYGQKT